MKAYIFPGQGAQFPGMGKQLFEKYDLAKTLFLKANDILGFNITEIMFSGSDEDLKQTKVTQPAIFLHSVILAKVLSEKFRPNMVAGHSLGEFSALVANSSLSFEDGLLLVLKRGLAMQKACEAEPSTMAAIIGLADDIIENICLSIDEIVVPANYNCPGQVVISGSEKGIDKAIVSLGKAGAKRALKLKVGGAFHSPLMEPAKLKLEKAIYNTDFKTPVCPVYQNVNAQAESDPQKIKQNLIAQLVSPIKWTQTVINMIKDGANSFQEVGPGKVLQGLVRKVDPEIPASSIEKD